MNREELNEILELHKKWLVDKTDGKKADLRYADLRYADLRNADLRYANLRDAYLRDADLRKANLQYANLQYANLQHADLRKADLDYSVFPLWCGSFNIITGDKLVMQLLSHIVRLNKKGMSKEMKIFIKKIPKKYRNEMVKRYNLNKV